MKIHRPGLLPEQRKVLAETVSFSVDCDALAHYLNFAPEGTRIENDAFTYEQMGRVLLNVFAAAGVRATFFCIAGELDLTGAARFYRDALAGGHSIGNHTLTHPDLSNLSEDEHLRQIREAHARIEERLGVKPVGYRAPAYFITEPALQTLAELNYLYDTSVCHSPMERLLLRVMAFRNKDIRLPKHAPIHSKMPGSGPYVLEFSSSRKILEFPIPKALGLSYYGTLHCSAPALVFGMQSNCLRLGGGHIHYELHPIEVVTREAVAAHPWLKNLPFVRRSDLLSWLERRIRRLVHGRRVLTLEELSVRHLSLLLN